MLGEIVPEVATPTAVPVEAVPAAPVAPPADVIQSPPAPVPPVAETPTPAGAEQPLTPPLAAVPPTAPTAPTPPAAPAVDPQVQEYIARLEEQTARAETQVEQATLRDWVAARATQLENDHGFTAEQAKTVAQQQADVAYRAFRAERFREGQMNAAVEIGQKFGVDPRRLMHLSTPQAMEQAATAATVQTQVDTRIKALEAENAALKKRLAPPQTFASGQGAPDGTRVTKDNIDALYLQDPDRYADTYRRFRRTGQIS